MQNRASTLMLTAAAVVLPSLAAAQDPGLHHAQTQALLSYADAEVKILAASLDARQFDMELTERMVGELKTSALSAKRSVERTMEFLDEKQEKARPEFEKLRAVVKRAEDQVGKIAQEIDKQVKPYIEAAESEESELEEEPREAPPEPDWDAIKAQVGWLYQDVSEARKLHSRLSRKVKMPRLKAPRRPKGKR